jgi:hypothetical protein
MKRKLSAAILAGMLSVGFAAAPAAAAPTTAPEAPAASTQNVEIPEWLMECYPKVSDFDDNQLQSQYYVSVRWLQCEDISEGYSDNTFRKGKDISRGEAVAFIQRYFAPGYEVGENDEEPFSDVREHHTHYTSISWAKEEGVVKGYGEGKFNSKKSITRGEFATMLFRAAMGVGIDLNQGDLQDIAKRFKDVDPTSDHFQAIQALAYARIINGYNNGEFRPYDKISRGEVAEMTFRGHQVLVRLGLDGMV